MSLLTDIEKIGSALPIIGNFITSTATANAAAKAAGATTFQIVLADAGAAVSLIPNAEIQAAGTLAIDITEEVGQIINAFKSIGSKATAATVKAPAAPAS